MWEREFSLPEMIPSSWEGAGQKNSLGDIHEALKKVMDNLQIWSKIFFFLKRH